MNIQKEIMISDHQPLAFAADTELRELYKAIEAHLRCDNYHNPVLAASVFYNLGRVHGIREERARKKEVRTVLHRFSPRTQASAI